MILHAPVVKHFFSKTAQCRAQNTFYDFVNLGEVKDRRCQLFEPGGRVLTSPGTSLRFIKKRFRTGEKGFGQQPVQTPLKHNPPDLLRGIGHAVGYNKTEVALG